MKYYLFAFTNKLGQIHYSSLKLSDYSVALEFIRRWIACNAEVVKGRILAISDHPYSNDEFDRIIFNYEDAEEVIVI